MPPRETNQTSRIKWNEVTWYSRLGAIILFVGVIPALCFYIGTQYELAKVSTYHPPITTVSSVRKAQQSPVFTSSPQSSVSTTTGTSNWKTYTNTRAAFEIQRPSDWYIISEDSNSVFLASVPAKNIAHGTGVTFPSGSMSVHVNVNKGTNIPDCNNPPKDYVGRKEAYFPDVSDKIICKDGFIITLELWNDDVQWASHKQLLENIANTFRTK